MIKFYFVIFIYILPIREIKFQYIEKDNKISRNLKINNIK